MSSITSINQKLVYFGLIVLSIGIFTSVSFSAVAHILLIIPGIYYFSYWIKERDFTPKKSVIALGAMIIICWLSVIVNWSEIDNPFRNIFKTKYFVISFLSYFSFHYARKKFLTEDNKRNIFVLFLVATTIATLSGLIGQLTGMNPLKMKAACHETRNCGLYGMYMTYGYGISLFMVLMTGIVIYREKFEQYLNRKWLYAIWFINFIGLLTSMARGAWIGFFLAIPFFFFKRNKKLFISVFLVGLVSVLATITFNENVSQMFLERGTSNGQRMQHWRTAITATYEKPMLGWGYKNFESIMISIKRKYWIHGYNDGANHAHNNIIEHLASTGILGALAFLSFLILWLRETYRDHEVLFPFVVSFIVSGMTQYTFGDGENLFLIMTIFSLI